MKKIRLALPVLLTAVFEIVFGVLLFKDPETFTRTVLMLFGIMLLGVGIVSLVRYLKDTRQGGNSFVNSLTLAAAIVSLVIGVICTFVPGAVIALFTVIAVVYGIMLLIMGVLKCQTFFAGRALGIKAPLLILLSSLITVICGIVIIMNPFESTHVMLQFLGIALIAQAVLDIVALVQVFLVAKVIEQAVEEVKNEVDSAAAAVVADANMAFHQADEELLKAEAAEIFNETPPVVDVDAEPAESAE